MQVEPYFDMSENADYENIKPDHGVLQTREARLISDYKTKEAQRKELLENPIIKEKSFANRMKTNRFWLVRGVYYVFYSVWTVVMAIGIFIAWLIAMLFI